MKIPHLLIQHSKKYTSVSVMLPSLWVKMQEKPFDYVNLEIFPNRIIVTPNFELKREEKKSK